MTFWFTCIFRTDFVSFIHVLIVSLKHTNLRVANRANYEQMYLFFFSILFRSVLLLLLRARFTQPHATQTMSKMICCAAVQRTTTTTTTKMKHNRKFIGLSHTRRARKSFTIYSVRSATASKGRPEVIHIVSKTNILKDAHPNVLKINK